MEILSDAALFIFADLEDFVFEFLLFGDIDSRADNEFDLALCVIEDGIGPSDQTAQAMSSHPIILVVTGKMSIDHVMEEVLD